MTTRTSRQKVVVTFNRNDKKSDEGMTMNERKLEASNSSVEQMQGNK